MTGCSGQVVGVAGVPFDVECLAYGGVPPPGIVWHVAGVLQPEEETFLDTWMDMETGFEVTRQLILILQIFYKYFLQSSHHQIYPDS